MLSDQGIGICFDLHDKSHCGRCMLALPNQFSLIFAQKIRVEFLHYFSRYKCARKIGKTEIFCVWKKNNKQSYGSRLLSSVIFKIFSSSSSAVLRGPKLLRISRGFSGEEFSCSLFPGCHSHTFQKLLPFKQTVHLSGEGEFLPPAGYLEYNCQNDTSR